MGLSTPREIDLLPGMAPRAPETFYRRRGKRAFDACAGAVGLVVAAPALALVALAVLLDDGAPVLFRQQRCGWRGRRFEMLKFRSMRRAPDAEAGFAPGDGRRVTRVGALLRRSKLDELPQLWNVVRGDMSLVGPRPEVPAWVEPYAERWSKALSVRPGITDRAAVELRDEERQLARSPDPELTYLQEVLPRKWELYGRYVDGHDFAEDLRILRRTLVAVVVRR